MDEDEDAKVDVILGVDPEIAALLSVSRALDGLPDDDARRRVIAYAQARCIKPLLPPPPFNYNHQLANAQQYNNPQAGPK